MARLKTLHDRFLAALKARGCSRIDGTSRHAVMDWPERPGMKFFVGRAGSLRCGRTLRESIPCTDYFKAQLLKEVP